MAQYSNEINYIEPITEKHQVSGLEKLRITLYDEYGRIINLNNMDWSCALMFECMYS